MEDAAQAARDLIQYCIDHPLKPGEGQYELEARFGRQQLGAKSGKMEFVVTVTPKLFWDARRRLKSFKGWSETRGPFQQTDIFHKVGKQVVRSSLTFEYEGKNEGAPIVTNMCKEKIVWRDVLLPITDEALGQLCVRICVSVERKVDVPVFAPASRQMRTRIKQRTTFLYKDLWEYACTRTWSGVDRVAADEAMNSPGWNELEIECLSVKDALKHYKGDSEAMAKSFVMKILDLAPPGGYASGIRDMTLKPPAKLERNVRRRRRRHKDGSMSSSLAVGMSDDTSDMTDRSRASYVSSTGTGGSGTRVGTGGSGSGSGHAGEGKRRRLGM